MKDAFVRAARTFLQTVIGVVLASGLADAFTTDVIDWTAVKKVGIAALVAGVTAVLSFVQNALETSSGVTYNKG